MIKAQELLQGSGNDTHLTGSPWRIHLQEGMGKVRAQYSWIPQVFPLGQKHAGNHELAPSQISWVRMRSQGWLEMTPYLTLQPVATGNTSAHVEEYGHKWYPRKKVCGESLLFTILRDTVHSIHAATHSGWDDKVFSVTCLGTSSLEMVQGLTCSKRMLSGQGG